MPKRSCRRRRCISARAPVKRSAPTIPGSARLRLPPRLSCVRDAFSTTKPFCARRMRSSRESISPSSRTKTANFRRMSPIFGDLKSFCTRCASGYRRLQRKCEAEKPMRFRSFTTAACRADTASCVCFAEIPTGGANTDEQHTDMDKTSA